MIRLAKKLYWRHSWIRTLIDWLGVIAIGLLFSAPAWVGIWLDAHAGLLSFLHPLSFHTVK